MSAAINSWFSVVDWYVGIGAIVGAIGVIIVLVSSAIIIWDEYHTKWGESILDATGKAADWARREYQSQLDDPDYSLIDDWAKHKEYIETELQPIFGRKK